MMSGKNKMLLLLAGGALALGVSQATAQGLPLEDRMKPICAGCHWNDESQIRGTLVPGSKTDKSFKVETGNKTWSVRYDQDSELVKFSTFKDLADDKALTIRFRPDGRNRVYAESVSYKPNIGFKNPEDTITIGEVNQLMQQPPEVGNYMIVDARGYDNYIEGHLPHATWIPHYRFNEFAHRLPEDKNTKIVAYCRGYG